MTLQTRRSAVPSDTAAPPPRRIGAGGGYAIAVASVVVATAARALLDPWLDANIPYLFYYLAVLFVAWRTQLGPSAAAFVLGVLAGQFFFVAPRYSWMLHVGDAEQGFDLLRFSVVAIAIIVICEALHRARDRAEALTAKALAVQRQLEHEVTERERAQRALQQSNDELERRVEQRTAELRSLNEALQRSNSELEQFAAVASHDLQEPLRKVQAFGDRLQTRCAEQLGDQGRDYLGRILGSAARMRTLIDDLLNFSRITTKAQPFVPIDLGAAAAAAVADLEDRMLQAGGRVEQGELPNIEADASQMRQLFLNLIGNGLKFHRPGVAPLVKLSSRLLPAGAVDATDAVAQHCEIQVEDNGIGFDVQYLDRIFEVFQRLHGRDEYEGTGIGLAICRKIVERHGGRITAHSTPGQGATFVLTLPVRQTLQEGSR